MYLPKDGEILGRGVYISPVIPQDPETGQAERVAAYYSWGACTIEVAVNVETGEVKVLRVGQSSDMGQTINPKICEGQTEGGIGMGIGSALYEGVIAEGGLLPMPPAVANTVYNAVGIRIKELPITREKVLAALEALKQ